MKILHQTLSDFLTFESDTDKRICLDICYPYEYGLTQSNSFYNKFYSKPAENFKKEKTCKLGDVFYTSIFSYHVICHMMCIDWPKTYYNLKPFKMDKFKQCCNKCRKYMAKNEFKKIYTPIFGGDVFEGNWNEILKTICEIFQDYTLYIFK